MAGYPKIWTCIQREPWWFDLTGMDRSILLQLYIFAKDGHDNGQIVRRSLAEMSTDCAVNRRTLDRSLVKMQGLRLLDVCKNTRGAVVITIHNYLKWQQMTAKEVNQYLRDSVVKVQSIPATTKRDETKPDETSDPEREYKVEL